MEEMMLTAVLQDVPEEVAEYFRPNSGVVNFRAEYDGKTFYCTQATGRLSSRRPEPKGYGPQVVETTEEMLEGFQRAEKGEAQNLACLERHGLRNCRNL